MSDNSDKSFFGIDTVADQEQPTEKEVLEQSGETAVTETELETEATEAKEPDEPVEVDSKKPKKSVQERINELTKARREAERNSRELAERLAALEESSRERLTGKPESVNATSSESQQPKPENFEFGELDSRYIAAMVDFQTKKNIAAFEEKLKSERQTEAAERKAQEVRAKADDFMAKGLAKFNDFDEVVLDGASDGRWQLAPETGELVLYSEFGPEIAYHLATNTEEAIRISGMSPLQQAAQIGRLEASFSSREDASKKRASSTKAPQPVQQARGSGGKFGVRPDTTDFGAFMKMFNSRG